MRREPRRWRTRFGRWIHRVGVCKITAQLRSAGQPVTSQAVYGWVAGLRMPRPDTVEILARMSQGAIRLQDIYAHRHAVQGDQRDRTPPPISSLTVRTKSGT